MLHWMLLTDLQMLGPCSHTNGAPRQPDHERRRVRLCLLRFGHLHTLQLQGTYRAHHGLLDWHCEPLLHANYHRPAHVHCYMGLGTTILLIAERCAGHRVQNAV